MKPGIKSTEFLVAMMIVIMGAVAQIYPGNEYAQMAGLVAAALASAGYGFARAKVKEAASQAEVSLARERLWKAEEEREDAREAAKEPQV